MVEVWRQRNGEPVLTNLVGVDDAGNVLIEPEDPLLRHLRIGPLTSEDGADWVTRLPLPGPQPGDVGGGDSPRPASAQPLSTD